MLTHTLAYLTLFSAIVAVVLAVARHVPLLHLLIPPRDRAVWQVTTPLAVMLVIGKLCEDELPGRLLMCTAWALGLAYLWWVVAWHLRERR